MVTILKLIHAVLTLAFAALVVKLYFVLGELGFWGELLNSFLHG